MPLVLFILDRSEKLKHYNLKIPNHGLKVVSSNASPGGTVRFLGMINKVFVGGKTYLMASMSPFKAPTSFLSSHLKSMVSSS